MLTSTAPTLAVAYCKITHSALFGDQIPTRSPASTPNPSRPLATSSTAAWKSA